VRLGIFLEKSGISAGLFRMMLTTSALMQAYDSPPARSMTRVVSFLIEYVTSIAQLPNDFLLLFCKR
jgi:hypothetical protein